LDSRFLVNIDCGCTSNCLNDLRLGVFGEDDVSGCGRGDKTLICLVVPHKLTDFELNDPVNQ